MLNFPKPTSGRRSGKSSMNIVLNFPNPSPAIGFGTLSRFCRPPVPAPRPVAGPPRGPRHSPGVGRPVPDLPSTKRGRASAASRRRLRYPLRPLHPTHGVSSSA